METNQVKEIKHAAHDVDVAQHELKVLIRDAQRKGLDVAKIARAAGVSRTTIYQWLREDEK